MYTVGFEPRLHVTDKKTPVERLREFNGFFGENPAIVEDVYNAWVEDSLRFTEENLAKYEHLMANIRKGEPYDVYAGRGKNSEWGNIYSHLKNVAGTSKVPSVQHAVAHHRWSFLQSLEDSEKLEKVKKLKGKRLGCFCKGNHYCHTIVILAVANHDWH